MGVEYELKFQADQQSREAIFRSYAGQWHTITMETTYYDTKDGAFSAKRCTLRRRLENGKSICTLKTPAGAVARGEWETECDSIDTAIAELCKLGAPSELAALASEGLIPVCGAQFTRQAAQITYQDTQLELALDQGILFGGSREEPLCEVEVELKSGLPEQADAFAKALAAQYGLQPQSLSKFARAAALRQEDDHGTAE